MEKKLTAKKRKQLIARHRNHRDGKVRDCIKSIFTCDDNYSYSEISRLLLDGETIRRHVNNYFEKNKLKSENGGSDSCLTERSGILRYKVFVTMCKELWMHVIRYNLIRYLIACSAYLDGEAHVLRHFSFKVTLQGLDDLL